MQSSAFDTYLLAYGKLFTRRAHYLLFACAAIADYVCTFLQSTNLLDFTSSEQSDSSSD